MYLDKLERLVKKDLLYPSADFTATTTKSRMEYKQKREQSTDLGGSKSKCV